MIAVDSIMEDLYGTHLESTFINVPANKDKPQALRGFVYLPPQKGLDDLGEDATFEQKRDRETTLEILSGTYIGKMTRRCGDEIGRSFPRLYPELWRPTDDEIGESSFSLSFHACSRVRVASWLI